MVISVTTGGPIDSIGPLVPNTSPSFSNLVSQIADEIDDTTSEYTAQIQTSVFSAIRWCEREPYYFNQTRDVTFATVEDQQFYGEADNEQIPRLGGIVAAWTEDAQGQRTTLLRWRPQEMESLSDNSAAKGEPYAFTYFAQQVRLYPIPGETSFTVRLQLGPYRLAPITDPSDSNVWTVEAFDMVKAYAKYLLYKDILKDANLAAEALNDYNSQHWALKAETSRRNGTGVVKATNF